jgi:hypothetical protein
VPAHAVAFGHPATVVGDRRKPGRKRD